MSDSNYATPLNICMLVSALALLTGVGLPVPDWLAFLAALAPLIWYHVMYLRPKAGAGLNQAAIDSVYYYGFLITIGALGATALDVSLHGVGEDFTPVAFQFGLGLLATGYAVWARVHLTASTKILDEEELREVMSQQIARSRELLVNVEMVSSSFEAFSNTLLQKSEQFASRVEAQATSSIDGAMQAFANGISSLSEQAQVALDELRGIVNDVTFGAERKELRRSVSAMVQTVAALNSGLDQLRASSAAGATSMGDFAGRLDSVNSAASSASARLNGLGAEGGPVKKLGEALTSGTTQAIELTTATQSLTTTLSGMRDKAAAAQPSIERIGTKAVLAAGKLEELSNALEDIPSLAEAITSVNTGLEGLRSGSQASSADFADVRSKLEALRATLDNLNGALIDSTGGLKDSMIATSEALEGALKRSVSAVEELASRSSTLETVTATQPHEDARAASAN